MTNKVFIATSLDGYIADSDGGIEWLHELPPPSDGDGGYSKFMEGIDAIVMGRSTYEKVLSFDCDWPYSKKVFVLSHTLERPDPSLIDRVSITKGSPTEIVKELNSNGYANLYIDGGETICNFIRDGLIHEMTITKLPTILGAGIPLFKDLPKSNLQHIKSETFDNGMVQDTYRFG